MDLLRYIREMEIQQIKNCTNDIAALANPIPEAILSSDSV